MNTQLPYFSKVVTFFFQLTKRMGDAVRLSCLFLFVTSFCSVAIEPADFTFDKPSDNEFVPTSTYRERVALFGAKVSQEVYADDVTQDAWLVTNGFTVSNLIEHGHGTTTALKSMQALVAHKTISAGGVDKNLYVVAFRELKILAI